MQTGWSIVTGVAALGIGLGAGVVTSPRNSHTGDAEIAVAGNGITFLGTSPAGTDSAGTLGHSLGLISFRRFSDARERLAELLDALDRLDSRKRYLDSLGWERLLDEIEQILSLASEGELVEFLTARRFTRGTVPLAEIGYGALARISPERAAEVWRSERDEILALPGLKVVMREWVNRDPAAAERWVDRVEAEEEIGVAKMVFLIIHAMLNPEEVVARLDETSALHPAAAILLGESLALAEMGETADRFLEKRADGSSLSGSLPFLLSSWGFRDPLAATSWFLSNDLKDLDEQQVTLALERAVAQDPSGVLEWLSPELAGRPQLRKVAGQAWWAWIAKEGNEVAGIEWIGQHAEAAAQFGSAGRAVMAARPEDWTAERVDRVLTALRNLPMSASLDRFAQSFIEQLAGYHPKIALSHAVEFLPPGPQSDQAIVRATMNWAAKEPEAALQWSLETFDDPGRAVDLASQISVPERRDREMIWHGREWMKKSPQAAETAIRSNPAIPDSVKAEIFK